MGNKRELAATRSVGQDVAIQRSTLAGRLEALEEELRRLRNGDAK